MVQVKGVENCCFKTVILNVYENLKFYLCRCDKCTPLCVMALKFRNCKIKPFLDRYCGAKSLEYCIPTCFCVPDEGMDGHNSEWIRTRVVKARSLNYHTIRYIPSFVHELPILTQYTQVLLVDNE